jgi:hypothetical protein
MINLSDITKTHFNERDVETPAFISFIRSVLADDPGITSLLDVGAHYSHATYALKIKELLASRRYVACDILDDPETAKIVDDYIVGNITELSLPKHDLVSCISVIEHCGITTYKRDNIEHEQHAVFRRMTDIAQKGLYLTFPYGAPGILQNQYSNIHPDMLSKFCDHWKMSKGQQATVNLQFFYNEFSPRGKPWSELSREEASKVPLRADLGIVQCVCIFEARC